MALWLIEKVEEPSEWCQRMVCVRRPESRPRIMVDLQPLNKFCKGVGDKHLDQAGWHGPEERM